MRATKWRTLAHLLVVGLAMSLAACDADTSGERASPAMDAGESVSAGLPQGADPVDLDPESFTTDIDNPWFPLVPGTRWVYEEDGDGETQRVEVTVTNQTKTVAMGIEARIVRDTVTAHGELVEDTYDWYAQDADGNVWYLGEETKEYEDGEVSSTEGSWEAGVNGALPGIVMPADPEPGMRYRQEYLKGEAEDNGEVIALNQRVEVPFDAYEGVVMTADTSALEPDVLEYKFYARGIGMVLALHVSGGTGREQLVEYMSAPG